MKKIFYSILLLSLFIGSEQVYASSFSDIKTVNLAALSQITETYSNDTEITPPKILYPKKNTVVSAGKNLRISWRSSVGVIERVDIMIEYYSSLRSESPEIVGYIAASIKNKNSYTWFVPEDAPEGYFKIAVVESGGFKKGESDFFKVKTKKISESNIKDKSGVTKADHFIGGTINSKVKLVTYSDLECPYCRMFDKTVRQLSQEYGNKVAFVFRHYPLSQIHTNALLAANATECVAKIGKEEYFSSYVYSIFKAQDKIEGFEITKDSLSMLAQDFGVDKKKFNMCLQKKTYSNKVDRDIKNAEKIIKITPAFGTPYTTAYGPKNSKELIIGAQSYDEVKQIIDDLLLQ